MMIQIESALKGLSAYRGWVWETAAAVAVFAVLIHLCRKTEGRYRYLQRKLPSIVLWASVAVAAAWLAWERDLTGRLMRELGISWAGDAVMQRAGSFLYERAVGMSVNTALVLFLAGYLLFKAAWILGRKLMQKKDTCILKKDCADVYEYNKEAACCVLKPEFVQVRDFYQKLFFAEGVIFGIARCAAARIAGFEPVFVMMVALCLYTWESFEYYSGHTMEEYRRLAKKETDHGGAAGELFDLLKDKVSPIFAEAEESIEIDAGKLGAEVESRIMEIQCSEDYRKRCMGYEWRQTLRRVADIHTELMEAALLLADHQSVYFPYIFYKELGPYLFPFLKLVLLDSRKILVISAVQEAGEELERWMSAGFLERYCMPVFWIAGREREIDNADIGIVLAGRVEDAVEAYDRYGFFRQVSVVVLLSPSCSVSSDPILTARLLSKLPHGEDKPVFIACDRNGTGMTDWLSHICKAEFTSVSISDTAGGTYHMITDMDAGQVLSAERELAGLLARQPGERALWYGCRFTPVCDVIGQARKETGLRLCADERGAAGETFFCVAEDSVYNASETLFQFRARGYRKSVTAICAPHYMLREFMISRMGAHGRHAIFQFLPEHVCSERNLAIAAGHRLLRGGMDWEELGRLCEYYEIDVQKGCAWLLGRLNSVYIEMLGLDRMWLSEDLAAQGESSKRIVISTEVGRQQFGTWYQENIEAAVYEREGMEELGEIAETVAGGHIFQYYLPGQFVVLEGKYYRIGEILLKEGRRTVRLKRASDSFRRRYYRQVRRICMEEEPSFPVEYMQQHGEGGVELHRAQFTIRTEEELCSGRLYDVKNAERRQVPHVPERVYRKKAYLKIYAKNQNSICVGILLRECFYTLFPHCWQLLCVAVSEKWMREEWKGYMDVVSGEAADDKGAIYIIEDSPMDLGLLEAIGQRFDVIMSLMTEYVEWGNLEGKAEVIEYFGDELLRTQMLTGMR